MGYHATTSNPSIIFPHNCCLTQFQKHNRTTGGLIHRRKFSNATNSSIHRAVSTRRSCFTVSRIANARFDANKSGIDDHEVINSLSITNNPIIVHVIPLMPRGWRQPINGALKCAAASRNADHRNTSCALRMHIAVAWFSYSGAHSEICEQREKCVF